MLSLVLILLLALCLAAFIWFLHRHQRRRTMESADRTTPLPVLDDAELHRLVNPEPDVLASGVPPAVLPPAGEPVDEAAEAIVDIPEPAGAESWLTRIKALREAQQTDAALELCRANFPRAQAFQQAVLILRQQVRSKFNQDQDAETLLRHLHATAALADLFRSNNPYKPADAQAAIQALEPADLAWHAVGYRHLKLLNKNDIRAMLQCWGKPAGHCHPEEVPGSKWITLCTRERQP